MTTGDAVSVVIPAYNRAATLPRAIESALGQAWPGLEIIVVDDGSTDTTPTVMDTFKGNLKYVRHERNVGAWHARNEGVRLATSPWIAFLDSDDYWLPGKLARQMEYVRRRPAARQVSFHQVVTEDRITPETRPFRGPKAGESIGDYLFCHGGMIQTSTLLLRRDFLLENPFDAGLPRHQDWALCLSLERRGFSFLFVPEKLAVWTCSRDPGRISNQKSNAGSMKWLEDNRDRLSPRARAAFLAEVVAPSLGVSRRRPAALKYIWRAASTGAISPKSALRLAMQVTLPPGPYDVARRLPFEARAALRRLRGRSFH
jgi:glycosyltransferase involved in cell wall biosynthesis